MFFIPFYSLLNAGIVFAVSLSKFYPFGTANGDHTVPKGDDTIFNAIPLRTAFQFFHKSHRQLFVNINGDISFDRGFAGRSTSLPFEAGNSIIAVYMFDLDTNKGGDIFYRESTDQAILQNVSSDIRTLFDGQSLFNANWSFLVTWDRVAAYSDQTKLHTFQCVLVSNGRESYVINLYHRLDVSLAQVGFDSGDGKHNFTMTASKTNGINSMNNIVRQSNVQVAGKFIYRVDQIEVIEGAVDECRRKTCYHDGICLDLPGVSSWECICKPGFTGYQCQTVINECNYHFCGHGGTCIDLPGYSTWKCNCPPGYTGMHCETVIDECKSKTCYHNGSCIDLPGFPTWRCNCRPGYTDRRCETDINECENATCVYGHCKDDINTFQCDCFFFAKGTSCSQLNILPIICMSVMMVALLSLLCFAAWFKSNLPCNCNESVSTGSIKEIKTHPMPVQRENPNAWLNVETSKKISHTPKPALYGFPTEWSDDLCVKSDNQKIRSKPTPAQSGNVNTWLN